MNENSLEKKVALNLESLGFSPSSIALKNPLGLAVSGGADSMALLYSVKNFLGKENIKVVTVDHGIRSEQESGGDAAFVTETCKNMGVFCRKYAVPQGKILGEAKSKTMSVEEVARKYRYEVFESFIAEYDLSALCTAHNMNDHSETLLMRFLCGSGAEGSFGIAMSNGKIIRPLLNVSRAEIESYLKNAGVAWRTDETNKDNAFFRNKVRNILVPVLNKNFPFWMNNLISGGEKAFFDNEFFAELIQKEKITKIDDKSVQIMLSDFDSKPFAIKRRLVLRCVNEIGFGERFPFKIIRQICTSQNENSFWNYENLNIFRKNGVIAFERNKNHDVQSEKTHSSGFMHVIEAPFFSRNHPLKIGELLFYFEGDFLFVESEEETAYCKKIKASFPLCIRSPICADKVKMADGREKKLQDVFSDWKVDSNLRERIPVVQSLDSSMAINAVLGESFGFKDWIILLS